MSVSPRSSPPDASRALAGWCVSSRCRKCTRQIQVNSDLNGFHQIQIHQVALGGSDGEAEFRTSHAPTWGRLSEAGNTPDESGELSECRFAGSIPLVADEIPARSSIHQDGRRRAPRLECLGGRKLLERARPLMVIEFHHTYQAAVVDAALDGLDYTIKPLVLEENRKHRWRVPDTRFTQQVIRVASRSGPAWWLEKKWCLHECIDTTAATSNHTEPEHWTFSLPNEPDDCSPSPTPTW